MTERPTPIQIRDGYPFMVIALDDQGDHHMQIPSALSVSKIVKAMDDAHLAGLVAMRADLDPAQVMTLLKDTGPQLIAGLGALIGTAWRHESLALEATDTGDLVAYGEAVYEEMHGHGYRLEAFLILGMTIIRAIWEHAQFTDEVSRRASFFFPMLARNHSPESTQGSSTLEIPGDSTD